MSAQSVSRKPAGQPSGGEFATSVRAPSGIALVDEQPGDAEVNVHTVSRQAGWPLLGDVVASLHRGGDVTEGAANRMGDYQAVMAGDDLVGPTIDGIEDDLIADWRRRGGGAADLMDVEVDDIGTDTLRSRCEDAGVPDHTVGFLESVHDRGDVPAVYLADMDENALSEVYRNHVAPLEQRLVDELGEDDSPLWDHGQAATAQLRL